jgi:hypothetical protein
VFRHHPENGLLDRMEVKLVTSEFPHAAYVNGKRLRPEKGSFLLLANTSDGDLQRIPITPTQAADYFVPGRKPSRDDITAFWPNTSPPTWANRMRSPTVIQHR